MAEIFPHEGFNTVKDVFLRKIEAGGDLALELEELSCPAIVLTNSAAGCAHASENHSFSLERGALTREGIASPRSLAVVLMRSLK